MNFSDIRQRQHEVVSLIFTVSKSIVFDGWYIAWRNIHYQVSDQIVDNIWRPDRTSICRRLERSE